VSDESFGDVGSVGKKDVLVGPLSPQPNFRLVPVVVQVGCRANFRMKLCRVFLSCRCI